MAVKIGSARIDENGNVRGGKAGDQTGKEVSTQNWYKHSKGWVVLRPEALFAEKIAKCMEMACDNQHIGYDQDQRNSLYTVAKPMSFDVSKVISNVETDCSALVRVCCAYAGIIVPDFNTSSEADTLMASGYFKRIDDQYSGTSDYLKRGDVLVTKTKGHTVIVLSDGAKAPKDQLEGGDIIVTGERVNIRTGPGTNYTAISCVCEGETLELPDTDGWLPVKHGGHVYWISEKYVRKKV